VLGWNQEK
jgi:hypothetical protein